VYQSVLKDRSPSDTIRIWIPGCSTGEEAYSHAISLLEYVAEVRADVSIQIFASDLSVPAVRKARLGLYKDGCSSRPYQALFYQGGGWISDQQGGA
jgi:two-component system CheB/CheR fusion protein